MLAVAFSELCIVCYGEMSEMSEISEISGISAMRVDMTWCCGHWQHLWPTQ